MKKNILTSNVSNAKENFLIQIIQNALMLKTQRMHSQQSCNDPTTVPTALVSDPRRNLLENRNKYHNVYLLC